MEAETLGGTLRYAQALVDTLVGSQVKMQAETLGDLAEALFDTLAESQAEVEAETLGDKLSDA